MNEAINEVLEVILGQVPEAIYFSLFMIYTKQLKEKRILFIVLMIVEYLLILYNIKYDIWIHITYIFMAYLTLKILYKEKTQITDIFTFGIASIVLILISIISFIIFNKNMIIATIVNRILMFLFLIIFHKKLNKIQNTYKYLWNRNNNKQKIIKSTTFRCLNLVIFNIMFYILNILMLYATYYNLFIK